MGDVKRMVKEAGIDAALAKLYDAGVYLAVEEARGRAPVRRGILEFDVAYSDLDNPLLRVMYEGQSSGSRSGGRAVWIDFGQLSYEASYVSCLLATHGVTDRPIGIWRPVPPDIITSFAAMFRYTKSGKRPQRWFSQAPVGWDRKRLRHWILPLHVLGSPGQKAGNPKDL